MWDEHYSIEYSQLFPTSSLNMNNVMDLSSVMYSQEFISVTPMSVIISYMLRNFR